MRKFLATTTTLTILTLASSAGMALPASAATPQEMQGNYAAEARKNDASFKASGPRGESLFRTERTTANGEKQACATCHTADPRQAGKTRALKPIEPMAPSVNAARFTDAAKVEKWFGRNCNDVLSRPCNAAEKADFITWLLSIK